MTTSSKALGAAAAATALLALAGCGAGGGDTSSAGGGTVKYALAQDPGKLNPITNATAEGIQVTSLAYESLLDLPAGAAPVGRLAATWESTTTTATFTLKDGITCSDGTPLTASDVKATFEYAADPDTGSPFLGAYVPADGVDITADDAARTVTFTAKTPSSFLAESVGQLPIVCAAGLKDPSTLDAATAGTGPYVLGSATAGQSYTLTRRADYYQAGLAEGGTIEALPETIEAQVVTDTSTQANMLAAGDLNLARISGQDRDRLDKNAYTTVDVSAGPGNIFFNLSEKRTTSDLAVRTALAQVIERDAVGKVLTQNAGEPSTSIMPNDTSVCPATDNTSAIPAHDIAAAEAALDSAGWASGADGTRSKDGKKLTLKVLYNSQGGAGVSAAVELIQSELAAIGVAAEPAPSDSYTDVIFSGGDWDLVLAGITVGSPGEWAGILSGDVPPNGGNWTYNDNKAYFAAVDAAQQQAGEASCEAWSKADATLLENVNILPTWEATETYYGKGVSLQVNSGGVWLPTTLRVS